MSTTTAGNRRTSTLPPTLRTQTTGAASLRVATSSKSSTHSAQFSLLEIDTTISMASATLTDIPVASSTVGASAASSATCSADRDCAAETTCTGGKCVTANDAALFGGSGSEPTSRLTTAAAVGVSIGVLAFIALLVGVGCCFWKFRGKRMPLRSIERLSISRDRSASNATDQKTLVASLPNSPQNAAFRNHVMQPELFAKALTSHAPNTEKTEHESIASKTLPAPPSTENPLPPPPTEPKRYALNVNINKSMIFDDEALLRSVSPLRDNATPRERTPKYRFKEVVPPGASNPSIAVPGKLTADKRSSEYELANFPDKHSSSYTTSTRDDWSEGELASPVERALSKLQSKAPQLPLPDLPPSSPSFSFHSYDWYQDIIGDPSNGDLLTPITSRSTITRTPTEATFPTSVFSPQTDRGNPALTRESLSRTAPPAAVGVHLHPSSAAISTAANSNVTLSSAVFSAPSLPPKLPFVLPTSPPKAVPARTSSLSSMTRATHNSRSWLPDDGLYLSGDGTDDAYMNFRTSHDVPRPTSYSPLV